MLLNPYRFSKLTRTDSFTGTTGTALPTYSANWSTVAGSMAISSNRAIGTGSGANCCRWSGDSWNQAHSASCLAVTLGGGLAPGPAVRCQSGAASYYYAFLDAGTLYAGESIAGSLSDWDSGHSVASGSVVKMSVDPTTSTTIRVYDDGVEMSGSPFTGKSALSGGSPGVCMYGSDTASYADDWVGANV